MFLGYELAARVCRRNNDRSSAETVCPQRLVRKTCTQNLDSQKSCRVVSVPKPAPAGWKVNVIFNGTMSTGKEHATRIAPAIPIKIVAG